MLLFFKISFCIFLKLRTKHEDCYLIRWLLITGYNTTDINTLNNYKDYNNLALIILIYYIVSKNMLKSFTARNFKFTYIYDLCKVA